MPKENNVSRETALSIINAYPETERQLLLKWAQHVIAIRGLNLTVGQKMLRIVKVTNDLGMAKPLLTQLFSKIQRVAWDDRSKPMRGVIGGAGIGLIASIASPMAGVAAFGGAIAVPVILLGAGGGAVLMAIIDELASKE